jgi:putative endonuclease
MTGIKLLSTCDNMKDTTRIDTGKAGENIAAAYLKKNGYRIYEANFRCALGEIDLIAQEKKEMVFIEVKTRKSRELGYPEQAVGRRKQKKMSQLALWYLREKKLADIRARFDVVAITMLPEGNEIRLFKNAFDFIES